MADDNKDEKQAENHSFKIASFLPDLHFIAFSVSIMVIFIIIYLSPYWYTGKEVNVDHLLTYVAVLAGVLATSFTAVYEAKSYQKVSDQVLLDKKQKAYDICEQWNSKDMREVRKDFRVVLDEMNGLKDDDLLALLKNYDLDISCIFGYFEQIALAIKNDLADEQVLYDQLKSAVVCNFDRFGVYIKDRQVGQPCLYEHSDALADRWRPLLKKDNRNSS